MKSYKYSKISIIAFILSLIPLMPMLFLWTTKYRFIDQVMLLKGLIVYFTPLLFFLSFVISIVDVLKKDRNKLLSKIALCISSLFWAVIMLYAVLFKNLGW